MAALQPLPPGHVLQPLVAAAERPVLARWQVAASVATNGERLDRRFVQLSLGAAVSLISCCTLRHRRHCKCATPGSSTRQLVVCRAKAYRMPLPPDVDEIRPPRWSVLMDAVENMEPEDVVIPTWKLKPRLGIYSPTPQYAPLHYIEPKPFYMKSNFVKRKMKKFYSKLMEKRMEKDSFKLRFLPNPKDRIALGGLQLQTGTGIFKAEEDMWKTLRKMSTEEIVEAMNDQKSTRLGMAGKTIMPNWRPGFQTVAIRDLKDYLKRVDVVLEVRDARAPWATAHPDIPEWIRPKPRVIVLTKADLVPRQSLEETIAYMRESDEDRGIPIVAVDAQRGSREIEDLRLELMKAGAYVNRRRKRKGVNPRAIRTIMVGFPNVGKSSLINRLAGRKVALKTNWAGTTRRITWHKIGGFRNTELEFLDCPGVIPVCFGKRYTEEQAAVLCMCRIFGEKIIDRQKTAFDLVQLLGKLAREHPGMVEKTVWRETLRMYGVDFQKAIRQEGPILPNWVPVKNPEPFCGKLLNDFNRGYWGKIQLEAPPSVLAKRQDWSHAFGNVRTAEARGIQGTRIRGELAPPIEDFLLPAKQEAEREKILVSRSEENNGGLFDGW